MSLIRYATRIHFAERVLEDALPEEVKARGVLAPLVVVDADTGPALARVLDCLPVACRPRVLDLAGLPTCAAMGEAVARALQGPDAEEGGGATPCDAVIGVGGAPAVSLAQQLAGDERAPARGSRRSAREPMPILTVPTLPGCLGLGPQPWPARERRGGASALRVPDVVFCDPSLVRPADPARLATSGMDALVHCLEAFLANVWNPPADGMAYDGLRRASLWLERLVADPADADAGREMLAAALNGALAAQKGLGAIHAIAHALETMAVRPDSHGELHAALVGPVLAFNAPAVPERLAIAAQALQVGGEGRGEACGLVDHLAALGARLGLPVSLAHLGLTATGIDRIAAAAARAPANRDNPRYANAADYRRMIEDAS